MAEIRNFRSFMRVSHRYLGYFMVGIMVVYALSGILLIYRDTDFLKIEKTIHMVIDKNLSEAQLSDALRGNKVKVIRTKGAILYLNRKGHYNKATGDLTYHTRQLPLILEKMTQLHKAKSGDGHAPLNIFFGLSLLFFVISGFGMFNTNCKAFKRGMWVATIGMVLTVLLIIFF